MRLTGRSLVAAMCVGQLGNLLPHVTVPAIMAQSLMPLWGLSATEAGAMASGLAFGYMLAVPVLATPPLRVCAYVAHLFPEQGHCRKVSLEHGSALEFPVEIPLTRPSGGCVRTCKLMPTILGTPPAVLDKLRKLTAEPTSRSNHSGSSNA